MKRFFALLACLTVGQVANAELMATFAPNTDWGSNAHALSVTTTTDWQAAEIDINLTSGSLINKTSGIPPQFRPTLDAVDDSGVFTPGFAEAPIIAPGAVTTATRFAASWSNTGMNDIGTFEIGAFSLSPDANGTVTGRIVARNPDDAINGFVFSLANFAVVNGAIVAGGTAVDPVAIGNPVSGSSISLQGAFNDGTGLLANAITLTNGEPGSDPALSITDLVISDDAEGLFGATFNGLNIDLTIDVDAARNGPKRNVSALLTVNTNGGVLTYNLGARVPEPSTVALSALALVGLVGFARRKK